MLTKKIWRLNLEADFTENYGSVNAVLSTCTVAKDSTLASDHSWWVANHPIHPLRSVPGVPIIVNNFRRFIFYLQNYLAIYNKLMFYHLKLRKLNCCKLIRYYCYEYKIMSCEQRLIIITKGHIVITKGAGTTGAKGAQEASPSFSSVGLAPAVIVKYIICDRICENLPSTHNRCIK